MIDHKTVSLADQIFERLENDILSGKYQKGEIITELKLCDELGVSRTPIREALRRLINEHILEESGKGSIVIGISKNDVSDIYTIRENIEPLALEMAISNSTDGEIKELEEIVELQEFYLSKNDSAKIREMDNQFHERIYKLSKSVIYHDTLSQLHKKVQKFRKASIEYGTRASVSTAEHRAILEAVKAKNTLLAKELIKKHIQNAYENIMKEEQK